MTKTLIIPDIHLKWHVVDAILAHEDNYDSAIFLGDYFDDFGDSVYTNVKMAEWIIRKMEDPRHIFLVGNHDINYMHGGKPSVRCSGYSEAKAKAINDVMGPYWDRMKWFHFQHDILFSHAGVTARYAAAPDNREDLEIFLNKEVSHDLTQVFVIGGRPSWILGAGTDRGGLNRLGGILWCDHMNHVPFTSVRQIYGHSPVRIPDYKLLREDKTMYATADFYLSSLGIDNYPWSLNLDTHLRHYGVIQPDNSLHLKVVDRKLSPNNRDFDTIHVRRL